MKKCIKCSLEKENDDFYGVQGDCKECTKKRVKKRYKELLKDPVWHEKEKRRHREKHYRLGYKSKSNSISSERHLNKYPEKRRAKNKSSKLKNNGFEKHHWSYGEGFEKDVIWLTKRQHNQLHRYLKYDKMKFLYKTIDGVLLDTKEKHLKYWSIIKQLSHE